MSTPTSPTSDIRTTLDAAVEGLYDAFARHRLDGPVDGCPHCTSPADDELLRSKPLRKLDGGDLSRFAFKAVTTLGTVSDLKHFLPRMLEILAHEGNVGDTDLEVVLGKLSYADWMKWPAAEQQAIQRYLGALWHHTLSEFPSTPAVDDCLCGIGQTTNHIEPFLQDWRRDISTTALRHMIEFVADNARAVLKNRRLQNAYWEEHDEPMRQVIDWLIHPDTRIWLENAFFQHADQPLAAEISQTESDLGWLRNLP